MIRKFSSSFRTQYDNGVQVNLADMFVLTADPAGYSGWSSGARIVDTVALQPPSLREWDILGYSIEANLFINNPVIPGNQAPMYGKLGTLYAGISQNSQQSYHPNSQFPWDVFTGLPLDSSWISKLWDPASDPLPPVIMGNVSSYPAPFPVSVSENLPSPAPLQAGGQLTAGIWLTPFLGMNAVLQVWNGSFTVLFDDHSERG